MQKCAKITKKFLLIIDKRNKIVYIVNIKSKEP